MKKIGITIVSIFILVISLFFTRENLLVASDKSEPYFFDSSFYNSVYESFNGCDKYLSNALKGGQRIFKYVVTDIDLDILINNLQHNARGYVEYKRWGKYEADAFYASLKKYLQALDEGRLSIDMTGAVYDSKGLLTNDPVNYLYNGVYISYAQYLALNNHQRKKCSQGFYPNMEVASYIDSIAKGIVKKLEEQKKNASGSRR